MAHLKLELPGDSVEVCPYEGKGFLAALGCYKHETTTNTRLGLLSLLDLKHSEDGGLRVSTTSSVKTSGVEDTLWVPEAKFCGVLGAAADGAVRLWSLIEGGDGGHTFELADSATVEEGNSALHVCQLSSEGSTFGASYADGECAVLGFDQGSLQVKTHWKAHDFSAWCIASFNAESPCLVATGGDDTLLRLWDTRAGGLETPQASARHDAGVASIALHPANGNWLLTGAYDDQIRCFDLRSLRRPLLRRAAPGGVWRLKFHPHDAEPAAAGGGRRLLAACMHGGVAGYVMEEAGAAPALRELFAFTEHESMAYGIDWAPRVGEGDASVISCSFYDQALYFYDSEAIAQGRTQNWNHASNEKPEARDEPHR